MPSYLLLIRYNHSEEQHKNLNHYTEYNSRDQRERWPNHNEAFLSFVNELLIKYGEQLTVVINRNSSAIAIASIGILSVLFVGTASLTSQIVAGQAEEIF